jgi:hypothetical protein
MKQQDLHKLCSSTTRAIKRRWQSGWDIKERRNDYKILAGNTEGKIPLGRFRRRWKENITVVLEETGCELDSYGS